MFCIHRQRWHRCPQRIIALRRRTEQGETIETGRILVPLSMVIQRGSLNRQQRFFTGSCPHIVIKQTCLLAIFLTQPYSAAKVNSLLLFCFDTFMGVRSTNFLCRNLGKISFSIRSSEAKIETAAVARNQASKNNNLLSTQILVHSSVRRKIS